MSDRPFTAVEKLIEVEALIEYFRWARSNETARENLSYRALKQIARDLRTITNAAPNATLDALSAAVARAEAERTDLGCKIGDLQELAWAVMKHWPEIKRALERAPA